MVDFALNGWWGAVNLVLEKRERVTTAGKGRVEIKNEIGKVTGMIVYVPTIDNLGNRHGLFSG